MANELWYEVVEARIPLTQGDLVLDCPLLTWSARQPPDLSGSDETEILKQASEAFRADVVVMTQACDLAHGKVKNVVLCPHTPLSKWREKWEEAMRAANSNPTEKAWKSVCDDIADGYMWNHALLNSHTIQEPQTEIRVVGFDDIFTVPLGFLQALVGARNVPRLRLRPPYREHLSQAFARFFMRVGLPTPLERAWR